MGAGDGRQEMSRGTDTALQHLSQVMWRERELLEELWFDLEVEQLILASGRTRWLMRAANEVESLLGDLRRTEMMRAVAADAVAAQVGATSNPSLRALAAAAPGPWGEILEEHREALVVMSKQISALADTNRELITTGYRSARETLMALGEATEGYAADGRPLVSVAATGPTLVDRSF